MLDAENKKTQIVESMSGSGRSEDSEDLTI